MLLLLIIPRTLTTLTLFRSIFFNFEHLQNHKLKAVQGIILKIHKNPDIQRLYLFAIPSEILVIHSKFTGKQEY